MLVKIRIRSARVVASAACFLLGACGGGVLIGTEYVGQGYKTNELSLIGTGDNELRVMVAGNPFSVSDDELASAVVDGMEGRTPGIAVNFAVMPEQEYSAGRLNYHVRMVFDPAPGVSSIGLCKLTDFDAAGSTSPGASSRMRLMGSYCQGDLTLTRAVGTASRAQSPSDPAFDQLMIQMTMTLFPITNKSREEARNDPPGQNLLKPTSIARAD